MEKKGLSQVIAVLLIVLFSLVAIIILWVVISSFISRQSEVAEAEATFFREPLDLVSVQIDANQTFIIAVNIKKFF